jgi:hypothetical protein
MHSSSYVASVGTAVKDVAGNSLPSTFTSGFTTAAAPAPAIYSVSGTVSGLIGSVVLQNNGAYDLTVSANGNFTFAGLLSTGAAYNVTVLTQPSGQACTVSSGSGLVASTNITNVAIMCKGWGMAELLETDSVIDAFEPQIAIDVNGNAIAVWSQVVGTTVNVMAKRYVAGTGWGPITPIASNVGNAFQPQAAIDANGDAMVVWYQWDGAHESIWANRNVGGAWGIAVLIETDNLFNAYNPHVAVDPSGNAIAVWEQWAGNNEHNIMANRYTPGSGWGTATAIEALTGHTIGAQVAVDAGGNAIVVWSHADANYIYHLMANLYTLGSGWGTAATIENNLGDAVAPQIAFDNNGNAMAVWTQPSDYLSSVWANRYISGSGWGTPTLIENNSSNSTYNPQVALDANGNAIVVWDQFCGSRTCIMANRYSAGSWGTAQAIDLNSGVHHAMNPMVKMDASGNAIAVWQQYSSSTATYTSIRANRYTQGSGWGTSTLIETTDLGDAWAPRVAVNASGNTFAVWMQHENMRTDTWVNSFH